MRAEIVKINSEKPEASLIRYAADQIRAGMVLGMPTDTFYGLAADPFNLRAVDRVYEIKSRSRHKPLSLLIESEEQAEGDEFNHWSTGVELGKWSEIDSYLWRRRDRQRTGPSYLGVNKSACAR